MLSPDCRARAGQNRHLASADGQAEPFASFDSAFQSLQHALAPDTPFHPRPPATDFFGLFNPLGYCRRFLFFRVSLAHASSIPVPLGSTGITPLPRYYGHSVLWSGAVLRPFGHERRLLVPTTDPCLPSLNLPAVPSPTTRCRPRLLGLISQPRLTARVSSYPSRDQSVLGFAFP